MAKEKMTLMMEPEVKEQAEELFESLGMDLSTATGIFYRQALRCHGIPFEIKADAPHTERRKVMVNTEQDDVSSTFGSVEDLMKALGE